MSQHAKQHIITGNAGYSINAIAAFRRSLHILKWAGVCIVISAVTIMSGGCASRFQKVCESGNDPAEITALIKRGANPNSSMGGSRFTPLQHAACSNQNPAIIKALIDAGADPNSAYCTAAGVRSVVMTPLQNAALRNRNPAIAQALIDGGADVNLLPPAGAGYTGPYRNMTPLAIAVARKNTAVADVIRKNGGIERNNGPVDDPLQTTVLALQALQLQQQQAYQQQQAQYQQRQQQQVAQNTGVRSAATKQWQAKANEASSYAAQQRGKVNAKVFSSNIGGNDTPTAGDLAVRNAANKLARTRSEIAAQSLRNDTRNAAAAPVAGNSPPPPPPVIITPVPVIVNNAAPAVPQQASQIAPPAAAAFSQQIEGGTADADRRFRLGLNAALGADDAATFDASDTNAELAREQYYRDANPAADKKKLAQAFALFTQAAKQGNRPAMYHLALMYKYGCGTRKNAAAFAKWLAAAAKAPYEPAIQLQNEAK